jgi:5-(carboxyamino)imidazole ribonucleotide synthase
LNNIKIGVIGGGQLGKMMILEGKKMGLHFTVLDPSKDCPASSIADQLIISDFYDSKKIRELAEKCDVVTFEFEHINAEGLIALEKEGYKIYPSPYTLKIIQDKYDQKSFLKKHSIPVPEFLIVNTIEEIYHAASILGLPLLLKSRKGGYDGKGNAFIRSKEDIPKAYESLGSGKLELMVEAYVPFALEVSAIAARGITGEIEVYPLAENIHKDNILDITIVPARVNKEVEEKAKKLAMKVMEVLEGIGVFCIEMFVDHDNRIYINEIAPRTHNSGHYSIEACSTSQFAQHLRGILEFPLGQTTLLSSAVMINLLGEEGYEGEAIITGVQEAMKIPGVYVHFYGKTMTKPKRKMGHVSILDEDLNKALEKAEKVRKIVMVISREGKVRGD